MPYFRVFTYRFYIQYFCGTYSGSDMWSVMPCKGSYKVVASSSSISLSPDFSALPATSADIKQNTDAVEKGNKLQEEANETSKGIFASIKDFFGSFFSNLINSVISLFVPSSDEMSALFDQLNQFFSNRFGFLYAPFDYMIRLCKFFISSTGSTSLTFPGFSIMGEQVWADQTYDLASDELVGTILGYVRTGTGILLAGYFIMFLQNFFKERFGTG